MADHHGDSHGGHGFGTSPVFLTSICTIIGAILFLRFGYAVDHNGILGTILIILIGHAFTIPTAMAVSEIATNLKEEGGGEFPEGFTNIKDILSARASQDILIIEQQESGITRCAGGTAKDDSSGFPRRRLQKKRMRVKGGQ